MLYIIYNELVEKSKYLFRKMNKKRSSQMVEEPVIGKKLSKKFPAILSPYTFFSIFE